MERGFSRQSDIVRDPKRNSMSHETLDSHMQIRYEMESMEAKSKCDTCQRKVVISEKDEDLLTEQEKREERRACLCHCKYSEISEKMLVNCGNAWRAMNEGVINVEEEVDAEGDNVVGDMNKRLEALQ